MTLQLLTAVHAAAIFGLIDPRLWYVLVAAAVWFITWMVRRYAPDVWARAAGRNPALAQVWMVVLGALLSAAPQIGRPLWDLVQGTLINAVLGTLGANGLHAVLRDMPARIIPYDGAQARVNAAVVKRNTPPGGLPVVPSSERKTPPDGPKAV
jgi:hypothetical protein